MLTEEEKKQRRKNAQKKYRNSEKGKRKRKDYADIYNKKVYWEHKEERKEKHNEESTLHYQKHKNEILERKREKYQENKDVILRKNREWKKENPNCLKQWREKHKEEISEYRKKYSKTPMGRASNLISSYRTNDKKHNRGECELTAQWIVENIFTSKCIYCGETDWTKLGCDRIDNGKPHTPDNVVPCCKPCNDKKGSKSYEEFCEEMGIKEPPTLIE